MCHKLLCQLVHVLVKPMFGECYDLVCRIEEERIGAHVPLGTSQNKVEVWAAASRSA